MSINEEYCNNADCLSRPSDYLHGGPIKWTLTDYGRPME